MKNKLMLIPLSLAILGAICILIGIFGADLVSWVSRWPTMYQIGVPVGILAVIILVLFFLFRSQKPAASATTTTTAGTTTATTTPTPTPAKKSDKESDPQLGWAIFGFFMLLIMLGGTGAGVYWLANFISTQVRTDAPFKKNIPVVKVVNPLLIGHDATPPPKPAKPQPRKVELTLLPEQTYKVAEMALGEYCVFEAAQQPFFARIRRTDQTEFTLLGTEKIGTKWRATWDGTLEVKSDTRNKITVLIIP